MPPIFSFEKMVDGSGYSINCCESNDQSALAKRLFLLSRSSWREIVNAPRHGIGSEKIERSSISAAIPDNVTEDVTFIAIRFHGKKPMVGYRDGRVFHVIWIDRDFSVYKHGK